ncbi:helix-turn-helix domain-containing protein [Marinomonas posidonica]|uniref:Transcriptional regulator, AraC family n=1 Tax=Marinomonas posidonica (strain CECT 7376 / NCIMB 14433 / IVIA-Po-181) TaxID=491952 RepID=F6D136_MARPP|nr:AraC family transcriptional regulator [Marinomonas posidonica]AEF54843.1 transcriptional regulator, AraC family [Marinomonas posidonica IVIA-Po-181]
MDILSDALLALKIKNLMIGMFNLSAPWGFYTKNDNVGMSYTALDQSVWVTFENANAVELYQGDSIILPRGGLLSIASNRDAQLSRIEDVWQTTFSQGFDGFDRYPPGSYNETSWGGGGEISHLMGMIFEIEQTTRGALFDALPNFILLRKYECPHFQTIKQALLSIVAEENNLVSGEYALKNNLSEALLRSQLRAHVLQTNYSSGIIAAIKDAFLHRALLAIHREPQKKWTVATLAEKAGLSRTAFSERFRKTLGDTPMNYTHSYRMQLAVSLLKDTKMSIEQIAHKLGYSSDRIFRAHFNRVYRLSPSHYRKLT